MTALFRKCIVFISGVLLLVPNAHTQHFPKIETFKKGNIATYTPEELWEYINGAAVYYIDFAFKKLKVIEYRNGPDNYIKAEIYEHSSPIDAFGIYAYERSGKAKYLEIGSQGYLSHSSLNFYKNTCYVKVHSNQKDSLTLLAIREIGYGIAKRIPELSSPKPFDAFPAENRIEYSEKYFASNYLGHSFLFKAREISYTGNKANYQLFRIKNANTKQSLQNLGKYLSFVKSGDSAAEDYLFKLNDMFNGTLFIIAKGPYLYGSIGIEDSFEAESLLQTLIEQSK